MPEGKSALIMVTGCVAGVCLLVDVSGLDRSTSGGLVPEGKSALIMVTGCVAGVCLLVDVSGLDRSTSGGVASRDSPVPICCGDGCCRALVNGSSIPNRSSIFGLLGTVGMADFC